MPRDRCITLWLTILFEHRASSFTLNCTSVTRCEFNLYKCADSLRPQSVSPHTSLRLNFSAVSISSSKDHKQSCKLFVCLKPHPSLPLLWRTLTLSLSCDGFLSFLWEFSRFECHIFGLDEINLCTLACVEQMCEWEMVIKFNIQILVNSPHPFRFLHDSVMRIWINIWLLMFVS